MTLSATRERARLWLLSHLPAGLVARPAEWFLAVFCTFVGASILLGASNPQSVGRMMPEAIYYLWGACLVAGSVALAVGLSSIRWLRIPDQYITTRTEWYRLGLRLLGLAAAIYAVGLIRLAGMDALPAAALTLYFAITCGVRLLTLRGKGNEN